MDSSAGTWSKTEPSPTSSQGIEPGDPRPRRVARDEVDLGEERRPVTLGELAPLQGQEGVLVGHRRQAEVRAAVAEVAAVVDLVVAVEGRSLRPRPVVRRHDADRAPARALERPGEGEAVVLDELVVAPLAVDPDPGLQGGVRQPAEPAERRRGEEGAARREAGGPQLRGAPVEHGVDLGRERRVLDGDAPVALDEHEQDVLAAQPGQQPVAGRGAEGVVRDRAGERRALLQPGPHRLHLVDGQGGGARRGDGRAGDPEPHPDHAQHRRRPERPARWPAATRVTRSSARTGTARSATTSKPASATARSAVDLPVASRSVSMPIPR